MYHTTQNIIHNNVSEHAQKQLRQNSKILSYFRANING